MRALPEGWEVLETKDTFNLVPTTGKNIKTKDTTVFGKYPVIDQGQQYICGYVDDEKKLIKIDHPVVIFGDHTRTYKWVDFNFVPGADGTKVLLPKNFLNALYFYHHLRSIELPDKGYARHFKFLKQSSFFLPPLNEQIRIANKLDSLLGKLEATQKRLDKIPTLLKRFRQSVLAAAVSGELTAECRKNDLGWEKLKIGDVVESIEAGKSIKCIERPPEKNEYGIIKISAVTWGTYNENESKTLFDKNIFLENRRVKAGDFLISRANTIELLGNPVIVETVTKNLMLSDKVLRLVMDESEKKWINIFLRSSSGRKAIELRATGNQHSMRNIGQKALLDIDFPYPSSRDKEKIVKRVEALFKLADKVEQQYQSAKQRTDKLTQSILAKAFRGELVPQDPNDEPASELLARILATHP